MSWYRKMIVAAFLESGEMEMFERWVDGIVQGIFASKSKIKLNRMDPAVAKLDKWFFNVTETAKNIWSNFRAGRLDAAINSGNELERFMPQMAKYFDTSDILQKLEMVTDTLESVRVSINKKKQQQQQWSNGSPPAQPQFEGAPKSQQPTQPVPRAAVG